MLCTNAACITLAHRSENVDVKDDQTENLDGVSNITAEIQPQKPVGDKSPYDQNVQLILKSYLPVVHGTPLNTACLAVKQQIPILYSLV
jgi:type VI protein secretion system component VasA